MAAAFEEQQTIAVSTNLSFDERFSMLVDRDLTWRDNRRVNRLLGATDRTLVLLCVLWAGYDLEGTTSAGCNAPGGLQTIFQVS